MKRLPGFNPRGLKPAQLIVFVLLVVAFKVIDVRKSKSSAPVSDGVESILQAYAGEESGVMVEAEGRIAKVLPDDNHGDRHQRFIIDFDGDHSVLIAHNIDLAKRVPAEEGDTISFKGQYEWSDQGGTIHWTHRDPQGRREGGWIQLDGKTYD